MMKKVNVYLTASAVLAALSVASQFVFAGLPATDPVQQPEPLTRDETYFSLARRNIEQSDSPASNVVGVLDEIIEIGEITVGEDGRTLVVVKEKTPSSASFQQKSIKVAFVPDGNKWRWHSFEDRGRFYEVERLFPFARNVIGQRKQGADAAWVKIVEGMAKQADAAIRVLETAKAVTKAEMPAMALVTSARQSLGRAIVSAKDTGDMEPIRSAFAEINLAVESLPMLGTNYPDLKANDAWLRLYDEFTAVQKSIPQLRKQYVETVAAYNEVLRRLPYGLVAYGLGFTKMEPHVEAE